ncbi:MAG: hypothetical protein IPM08_02130 [Actinomycetales bacterium]|nr:hypothetical protein [Actinomycetales bacterium]
MVPIATPAPCKALMVGLVVQRLPARDVHATAVTVKPATAGSVMTTLAAVDRPDGLLTVTVYVTVSPGLAPATPSVLVTVRSASGTRLSVSLPVLLAVSGSLTPAGAVATAVFVTEPCDWVTVAVTVMTKSLPDARSGIT